MNRNNVLMALDDAEVLVIADQCRAAMMEFANVLCPRTFILTAVTRAEAEGDFTLASVATHLNRQLAAFVLSTRDVHDYNEAFAQWLETEGNDLGEVRAPSVNFQ